MDLGIVVGTKGCLEAGFSGGNVLVEVAEKGPWGGDAFTEEGQACLVKNTAGMVVPDRVLKA